MNIKLYLHLATTLLLLLLRKTQALRKIKPNQILKMRLTLELRARHYQLLQMHLIMNLRIKHTHGQSYQIRLKKILRIRLQSHPLKISLSTSTDLEIKQIGQFLRMRQDRNQRNQNLKTLLNLPVHLSLQPNHQKVENYLKKLLKKFKNLSRPPMLLLKT
jgi:hypothetical protein